MPTFGPSVGVMALILTVATAKADEPVEFLSLEDLKFAIYDSIIKTQKEFQSTPPFFLITRIQLELKGTKGAEGQAGLKIPVFGATASAEAIASYSNSDSLTVSLSPGEPIATRAVPDIRLNTMVGAIKAAFKEDSQPQEALLDSIKLTPDQVQYTYSGVLKKEASGGLDFVFFKIGGELERQSLQVVTFDLCRTENMKNCVE